ncbi:RICIN domain-containing protein [Couchioplanes caeruleus subsp. azureus]
MTCPHCGQRNEQAAQFCTNPACGAYLGWEKQSTDTGTLYRATGFQASANENQRAGVRADLAKPSVKVTPGDSASTTVSVHNSGTRVEGLEVTISGPAAAWTTVEPVELSVYPEQSTTVTVRFAPPRSSETPAGPTDYTVRLASTINPGLAATVSGVAVVAPYRDLAAELVPLSASGRGTTTQQIVLRNNGNVIERLGLAAADDEGALTVRVGTPAVDLPPARLEVPMTVRARPRWFGRARTVPVRVTVTPATPGTPPIRLEGTRHLVPVFPTWVPALAAVLVLFGGGAAAAMMLAGGADEPTATSSATPLPAGRDTPSPQASKSSAAATPTPTTPPASPTPQASSPESSPPTSSPPSGKRPPAGAVALDEGTYRFRPRHSFALNKCLGIEGAEPAAWIVQADCAEVPDQQFQLQRVRSKVYRIQSLTSGLCVSAGAVGRGTDAFQDECDDTRLDQEFAFDRGDDTPDGQVFHLRPMHSFDTVPAGMCIGVGASSLENGGHVGQWDCQPDNQDQDFYLIPQ